jgi:hypothetical protein
VDKQVYSPGGQRQATARRGPGNAVILPADFVAVAPDHHAAWITLQENNSLAVACEVTGTTILFRVHQSR